MFLRHHFLTGPPFVWPDATNTGVPSGIELTPYADFPGGGPDVITDGNWATYFPGKLCQNMLIEKSLAVTTEGMTFVNCRINFGDFWGIQAEAGPNLTVIDCEFQGAGFAGASVAAILGQGWFERIHGHHANMAINITPGATTVKSCYFHTMEHNAAEPHWDGLFVGGGQTSCLFMDNLFHLPMTSGTAAIFIHDQYGVSPGPIRVIHNRCLGQPSYAMYCYAETLGNLPDVQFLNNECQIGDLGYILTQLSFPVKDGNVDAFSGVNIDSYDP